jgi:hypothetical protein
MGELQVSRRLPWPSGGASPLSDDVVLRASAGQEERATSRPDAPRRSGDAREVGEPRVQYRQGRREPAEAKHDVPMPRERQAIDADEVVPQVRAVRLPVLPVV